MYVRRQTGERESDSEGEAAGQRAQTHLKHYFAVRKSERRLYLIIHRFSSACPVQGQIQGLEPILAAIERG